MKRCLLPLLLIICFLFGCSSAGEEGEGGMGAGDGYFFPQGTTSRTYSGRIWNLSPQENEMELSITEVRSFEEGNLYEINCEEEVQDGYGINRLHLGLF